MSATVENAINEFNAITTAVNQKFKNLSEHQLNWKPAAEKWSIAQCLDHLIVSNETYYSQFDEIVLGKHKNSFYQNFKFIGTFLGKQMIKDLGPAKPKTFKNPGLFTPAQSNISDIITRFDTHQNKLAQYISKMDGVDLQNTMLYSPVTKVIIYNLADVLALLAAHEARHLLQAENVSKAAGFPV